ncbi:uncharacterized protein BXZ73DRAFT_105847 [Epithele typhae]|uniref:uncharacterized protein n=1 Tax=Epithele typhae TaxID=378194 RepID=UPI00200782AB|nr:uncharacterized protein BXZ73DRAFT_105847 [Epithele typhae]KAH9916409.1 hypothetical protein BXZ73DRAFT_105847 [Epithele typhae]
MTGVQHLILHVPLGQCRVPLGRLRSLVSLNTDAALLRALSAPLPPLRALSVYVRAGADEHAAYRRISRLFETTLTRLRVMRSWTEEQSFAEDSPARVLEYLEVLDLAAESTVELGELNADAVAGSSVQDDVGSKCANLRLLAWLPAWHKSIYKGSSSFDDVVLGYQADLLTQGTNAHFYPEGTVEIDDEEWRKA